MKTRLLLLASLALGSASFLTAGPGPQFWAAKSPSPTTGSTEKTPAQPATCASCACCKKA